MLRFYKLAKDQEAKSFASMDAKSLTHDRSRGHAPASSLTATMPHETPLPNTSPPAVKQVDKLVIESATGQESGSARRMNMQHANQQPEGTNYNTTLIVKFPSWCPSWVQPQVRNSFVIRWPEPAEDMTRHPGDFAFQCVTRTNTPHDFTLGDTLNLQPPNWHSAPFRSPLTVTRNDLANQIATNQRLRLHQKAYADLRRKTTTAIQRLVVSVVSPHRRQRRLPVPTTHTTANAAIYFSSNCSDFTAGEMHSLTALQRGTSHQPRETDSIQYMTKPPLGPTTRFHSRLPCSCTESRDIRHNESERSVEFRRVLQECFTRTGEMDLSPKVRRGRCRLRAFVNSNARRLKLLNLQRHKIMSNLCQLGPIQTEWPNVDWQIASQIFRPTELSVVALGICLRELLETRQPRAAEAADRTLLPYVHSALLEPRNHSRYGNDYPTKKGCHRLTPDVHALRSPTETSIGHYTDTRICHLLQRQSIIPYNIEYCFNICDIISSQRMYVGIETMEDRVAGHGDAGDYQFFREPFIIERFTKDGNWCRVENVHRATQGFTTQWRGDVDFASNDFRYLLGTCRAFDLCELLQNVTAHRRAVPSELFSPLRNFFTLLPTCQLTAEGTVRFVVQQAAWEGHVLTPSPHSNVMGSFSHEIWCGNQLRTVSTSRPRESGWVDLGNLECSIRVFNNSPNLWTLAFFMAGAVRERFVTFFDFDGSYNQWIAVPPTPGVGRPRLVGFRTAYETAFGAAVGRSGRGTTLDLGWEFASSVVPCGEVEKASRWRFKDCREVFTEITLLGMAVFGFQPLRATATLFPKCFFSLSKRYGTDGSRVTDNEEYQRDYGWLAVERQPFRRLPAENLNPVNKMVARLALGRHLFSHEGVASILSSGLDGVARTRHIVYPITSSIGNLATVGQLRHLVCPRCEGTRSKHISGVSSNSVSVPDDELSLASREGGWCFRESSNAPEPLVWKEAMRRHLDRALMWCRTAVTFVGESIRRSVGVDVLKGASTHFSRLLAGLYTGDGYTGELLPAPKAAEAKIADADVVAIKRAIPKHQKELRRVLAEGVSCLTNHSEVFSSHQGMVVAESAFHGHSRGVAGFLDTADDHCVTPLVEQGTPVVAGAECFVSNDHFSQAWCLLEQLWPDFFDRPFEAELDEGPLFGASHLCQRLGIEVVVEDAEELGACFVVSGDVKTIFVDSGLNDLERAFAICHEICHFALGHRPLNEFLLADPDKSRLGYSQDPEWQQQEHTADEIASIWLRLFSVSYRPGATGVGGYPDTECFPIPS